MTEDFSCQKNMQINSQNDVLQAMEQTVLLAEQLAISSNEQLLLSLVTEEALVNALEYCDTLGEKFVSIQWDITNRVFNIAVTQYGIMYPIEKKDEINYSNRGRGLQLILHIMDRVWLEQVNEHKVTLHMQKHLETKKSH